MLKISIKGHVMELKTTIGESRRFLAHFEKVMTGDEQTQRRFVFRGGEDSRTRTLVIDLRTVEWALMDIPTTEE